MKKFKIKNIVYIFAICFLILTSFTSSFVRCEEESVKLEKKTVLKIT